MRLENSTGERVQPKDMGVDWDARRIELARVLCEGMRQRDPSPLSLGELADLAGVSRATLYRHFKGGRNELCVLLHQLTLQALDGAVADRVNAQVGPVEERVRLAAVLHGIVDALRLAPYTSGPALAHEAIGYSYVLTSAPGMFLDRSVAHLTGDDRRLPVPEARELLRSFLFALLTEAFRQPCPPSERQWTKLGPSDPRISALASHLVELEALEYTTSGVESRDEDPDLSSLLSPQVVPPVPH
jgi:AcrR family transcriptional regulator